MRLGRFAFDASLVSFGEWWAEGYAGADLGEGSDVLHRGIE